MAVRACLGRCGRLINSGSYCPACRPRNGSSRRWRNIRARVLHRDRWTCQMCGARASHVDHIRPVLFGGSDDENNLQALCEACNLAKGANPPSVA
ncbi:MAG: HNH endonuclease [Actinomycetota bacterium]|nr:HNH endonuclease [Actinomycetota bacterium]